MAFLVPLAIAAGSAIAGHYASKNKTASSGTQSDQNIFNYGFPLSQELSAGGQGTAATGLNTMSQGLGTMDSVKQYFSNIMSGNRPAQLASVAPETNAINAQADATRNQSSWFGTSRGGGTAAANANADTSRMSAIDNSIFAARPTAATNMSQIGQAQASIGAQQSNIGLEQLSAGLRSLGLSEQTINDMVRASTAQQGQSYDIANSVQQQLRGFLSNYFGTLGASQGTSGADQSALKS